MSHGNTLIERFLSNESETDLFGQDLAACLKPGDQVALSGDLGAGKTALARAIIRSLCDQPGLEVPSPTFTLVQQYDARFPVIHADLYRLSDIGEIEELGLDDAEDGVVLVEWPENAKGRFDQADVITVRLEIQDDGRNALISSSAPVLERIRRSLEIRSFLDQAGHPAASRAHLTGDASARSYEKITTGSESLILMNSPDQPDGPPVRDGKPYSRIAHLAESTGPFIAIGKMLLDAGFAAPKIHAADRSSGLVILENLGADPFLGSSGEPIRQRYEAAADLLAEIHQRRWPEEIKLDDGYTHRIPFYDRNAQLIEAELLTDWYFSAITNRQPTADEKAEFIAAWNVVLDSMADCECSLVLRDYHSPNIIWREDEEGLDRLGLIDFQDAVIGPSAYDVASLAQDARVDIDPDLEKATVEAYCNSRARSGTFDRERFDRDYAIMTVQRNTKILGIFVRLDRRDGKPGYLSHLPRIKGYVSRSIGHPAMKPLGEFYRRLGIEAV